MPLEQQAQTILESYGWTPFAIQNATQFFNTLLPQQQIDLANHLITGGMTTDQANGLSAADMQLQLQGQMTSLANSQAANNAPRPAPQPGAPAPLGADVVANAQQNQMDAGVGTSSPTNYSTVTGTAGKMPQFWQLPDFSQQNATDYQALTGDNVQAGYKQYLTNFALAAKANPLQQHLSVGDTPAPMEQWLFTQMKASYGLAFEIGNDLSILYEQTYGQGMPADLRQEIMGQIANSPDASITAGNLKRSLADAIATNQGYNTQNTSTTAQGTKAASEGNYQTLANMLTTGGLITQDAPWLGKMITNYVNAHPTPDQVSADQASNLYYDFNSKLSRPPTADEITLLKGKSTPEILNYIDNATLGNGMTYGAYTTAQSRLSPLWARYFGSAPDDNAIKRFAGVSDVDLNAYISAQPSKAAPGLNIGQYESYSKTVDTIANKYYGYTSQDFLAGLLKAEGK